MPEIATAVKFCNGCCQTKQTTEFHKTRKTRSGFVSRCKDCVHKRDREGAVPREKDWWIVKEPLDRTWALVLSRYDLHLAKLSFCMDCEQVLSFDEFTKKGNKRPYSYCRACVRKQNAYHRPRHRVAKNASARADRAKLRLEVLRHYSGSEIPYCKCCGESHSEFLALDHIYGGGNKHKKEVKHIYKWSKRNGYPPIFRVLCHNCNQALGAYGYCPHNKAEEESVESSSEPGAAVGV